TCRHCLLVKARSSIRTPERGKPRRSACRSPDAVHPYHQSQSRQGNRSHDLGIIPFARRRGDRMRRRAFITLLGGAAVAWPLAARAQRPGKIARLGYLSTANPRSAAFFRAFEDRLRDLGYIEGQNILVEYRDAEGNVDRLPDLAADLVRLD